MADWTGDASATGADKPVGLLDDKPDDGNSSWDQLLVLLLLGVCLGFGAGPFLIGERWSKGKRRQLYTIDKCTVNLPRLYASSLLLFPVPGSGY